MNQERSGPQRMTRKDNIATNVNTSASGYGSGSPDLLENGNDDKRQDLRVSLTRSRSWSDEDDLGSHAIRDAEQPQSSAKSHRWSKAGSDSEMMHAKSSVLLSRSLSEESTAKGFSAADSAIPT